MNAAPMFVHTEAMLTTLIAKLRNWTRKIFTGISTSVLPIKQTITVANIIRNQRFFRNNVKLNLFGNSQFIDENRSFPKMIFLGEGARSGCYEFQRWQNIHYQLQQHYIK